MNVSKAIEITGEIVTVLGSDERYPFKKCTARHPLYKVGCEKVVCTNGKHYGIIGIAPRKHAVVWDEIAAPATQDAESSG